MSSTEVTAPDAADEELPIVDLRASAWDRLTAAGATFLVAGAISWVLVLALISFVFAGKLRRGQRVRATTTIAVTIAAGLAMRRFLTQYHRVASDGEHVWLQNSLRAIKFSPLDVQGIVGAGGVNLDISEMLIWKYLVLLVGGRRYVLSFDKAHNAIGYEQLRAVCVHAWGVPFDGQLETPRAGPELDPEDYVDALRHVRSYYRLHTQKSALTGMLMMGGAAAVGVSMVVNLPNAGGRILKIYFWLLVIAFMGLLLTVRALRQVPVLLSIRKAEARLRDAL